MDLMVIMGIIWKLKSISNSREMTISDFSFKENRKLSLICTWQLCMRFFIRHRSVTAESGRGVKSLPMSDSSPSSALTDRMGHQVGSTLDYDIAIIQLYMGLYLRIYTLFLKTQ